jgi:hypothetical protein
VIRRAGRVGARRWSGVIRRADFLDCSWGFRPGRSAHEALAEVRRNIKSGREEAYDADLSSYFDGIPHDELLKCVRMRVTDRSVLKLLRMWLEAPVVEPSGGDEGAEGEPAEVGYAARRSGSKMFGPDLAGRGDLAPAREACTSTGLT